MKSKTTLLLTIVLAIGLPLTAASRARLDGPEGKDQAPTLAKFNPAFCMVGHRVGQISLAINNNGTFGDGFASGGGADCITGEAAPSCEYPRGSNSTYLFAGAFWIGAVVGRDTTVSLAADGWSFVREFFPDESPFGDVVYRSISDPTQPEFKDAISEEDYICVYTDTITEGVDNDYFGRPHRPLYIEVTQSTYAWSYAYAEDFVLFDYKIKNIGVHVLNDVYMGIYVDADVWGTGGGQIGAQDDLCGFLLSYPDSCGDCERRDTVFTAWIADNDGEMAEPVATSHVPHVTATRIVRTPQDSLNVAFNWWISDTPARDFGPRHSAEFRNYGTGGLGTPEGDRNKYYIMSNGEFDYDQAFTAAIQPTDSLWLYPDQNLASGFADGEDTRYLLSFGPFRIRPGQTLPISFAYVAGADFHGPSAVANLANLPDNPDEYYANLDFTDLAANSKWASWIYDNPGVDTDGDDYFGEATYCADDSVFDRIDTIIMEADTIYDSVWDYTAIETCWIEGDGVPDFRGASPPPAPDFWLDPEVGGFRVRFNGLRSETTEDVFSRLIDFEGYRVYISRDQRQASFGVVASYDLEDFNKHVLTDPVRQRWELRDAPFTQKQLEDLYASGDENFDPLRYTRSAPYVHPDFPDSVFFFEMQDYNVSRLGIETPIQKIYPNEPYPSSIIPDSARSEEKTEDGYLKYFEYEVTISDLLPSVQWYINITAFDYGSPQSGLESLESSRTSGAKHAYAFDDYEDAKERGGGVFAYPNPYRIDAGYAANGFEGRATTSIRSADRIRGIHFGSLPPKCRISIFSLDGDLVREYRHDVDNPPVDRSDCFSATTDCWDLITRNTQLAVSGMYYYTVEADNGETQIGKIVLIM
jgi:hypothetical protein